MINGFTNESRESLALVRFNKGVSKQQVALNIHCIISTSSSISVATEREKERESLYINIFKNFRRAKYRCSLVSPPRLQRRILSKASLQPSIEPYVSRSVFHRILRISRQSRGRQGEGGRGRRKGRGKVDRMVEGRWERGGDRCGVSRGKKSGSKGIFIEWILKLMVATSDMLIRRTSGFLITPGDGQEITEG